jgi:hypothetical protein
VALKKLTLKAGVNQENTRYTNENGWWLSDKMRFRQGTPEKIGGWQKISSNTFLGVCRSLWNWVTLGGLNLVGVGTNLKFYIEKGAAYYDITPLRKTVTLGTNPFSANGTTLVTITSASHGGITGDYVTFSGATGTYASILNADYPITVTDPNTYTITTPSALTTGSYGGSAVSAAYQISIGPATAIPTVGWGAGTWGAGTWGFGGTSLSTLRIWNQTNFGQNLIFGPRGGAMYYWDANTDVTSRGILISSLGGAVTFTSASPTVVTATITFTPLILFCRFNNPKVFFMIKPSFLQGITIVKSLLKLISINIPELNYWCVYLLLNINYEKPFISSTYPNHIHIILTRIKR